MTRISNGMLHLGLNLTGFDCPDKDKIPQSCYFWLGDTLRNPPDIGPQTPQSIVFPTLNPSFPVDHRDKRPTSILDPRPVDRHFQAVSMNIPVVMTIIGPDQPGLVEAVSAIIEKHHGNWEESRMARLSGQFAGILKIELAESRLKNFQTDLAALKRQGLNIVLVDHSEPPQSAPEGHRISLHLVGNDHEGIVHRISQTLAAHGINVESFESDCESAPWSGEKLFKATAELRTPTPFDIEALRSDLEELAGELMVDFTLNQSL